MSHGTAATETTATDPATADLLAQWWPVARLGEGLEAPWSVDVDPESLL